MFFFFVSCCMTSLLSLSTPVYPSHLPGLSWPSVPPPGSRLQAQLRSLPHCVQAVAGDTCHRSPAAWRRFCTGSFGREKLWRTGLWAAAATSAARQEFYPSTSSLSIMRSVEISYETRRATLFWLCSRVLYGELRLRGNMTRHWSKTNTACNTYKCPLIVKPSQ